MRIKINRINKTKWHDWFAWYPVIDDGTYYYRIIWLEKVSRKGSRGWIGGWSYEYLTK